MEMEAGCRTALSLAREQGSLPERNYRMEMNVKTGDVRFLPQPVDGEGIPVFNGRYRESGWIGAFVEDDSRIRSVASALLKKIRRAR